MYEGDGLPVYFSGGFLVAVVTVAIVVVVWVVVVWGGGFQQLQINNNNNIIKEDMLQKLNKPDTNYAGIMAPVTQQSCILIKFYSGQWKQGFGKYSYKELVILQIYHWIKILEYFCYWAIIILRRWHTKRINQGLTLVQNSSKVSYHALLRRESLVMRYVIPVACYVTLIAQWPKNSKYHGQNSWAIPRISGKALPWLTRVQFFYLCDLHTVEYNSLCEGSGFTCLCKTCF